MMVTPSPAMRSIRLQKRRREIGSTPPVGSSRKSTRGRWSTEQARARRCFQPPGSDWVRRSCLAFEPRRRHAPRPRALPGRGRAGRRRRRRSEVLADGQVVVEAEALGHVADAPLHVLRLAAHVEAEHARPARGGGEQAAEHADGGGLARAVAAQQAEHLAFPHGEAEVVDGGEGAEALDQPVDLDDVGHRPTARSSPARATWMSVAASGQVEARPQQAGLGVEELRGSADPFAVAVGLDLHALLGGHDVPLGHVERRPRRRQVQPSGSSPRGGCAARGPGARAGRRPPGRGPGPWPPVRALRRRR